MNIVELFSKHQREYIEEFKSLLNRVKDAVLRMTESIPEEVLLEYISTYISDEYFTFYEAEYFEGWKKGMLVGAVEGEEFGVYPYDLTATNELDEFIRKYYPGIKCNLFYSINLYSKIFEFWFELDTEFSGDELDQKVSKIAFEQHIFDITHQKFNEKEWERGEIYVGFPLE